MLVFERQCPSCDEWSPTPDWDEDAVVLREGRTTPQALRTASCPRCLSRVDPDVARERVEVPS